VLGKNGVLFKTYVFCSAKPEMPVWTRGRGLSKFLFETGLDKLPQLWNVLRGKMSLVGPRPVKPALAVYYQEWLPNLLSLKPGMTGARASSAENSITLEQEMRLELYYARNYSIWLDLQIVFQTLVRILHRERVLRKDESDAELVPAGWKPITIVSTEH
jgi:lipopolysaccharide/colanic/teichoic acid biosynthesis glycosyltransferase